MRQPSRQENYKIALIGNPNCGKTTLFNQLTGLNQKVGNFAGVTIERKIGQTQLSDGSEVQIIDLPGTYSIYPRSYDEQIVFDILTNPEAEDFPDLIAVVVDASNLKRNLLLFTQIYDLGLPVVLVLNMIDVAQKNGLFIDENKLNTYFSVPIIKLNARNGEGINEFKDLILTSKSKDFTPTELFLVENKIHPVFEQISKEIDGCDKYKAKLVAHQYKTIRWIPAFKKILIAEIIKKNGFESVKEQTHETIERYQKINKVYDYAVNSLSYQAKHRFSEKLDKILTHRVFGYALLITVFYLIFQAIFSLAAYPMDLIDGGISLLNNTLKNILPASILTDLLTDGIIAGLGGILIFIPQIAILFAFIAIFEETGYMARVMFLMDQMMKPFGLNGKSIVPLFSGAACAIPAIMSARNISNFKERMITIFVTPLISCSARIPVYTIIIALVIPNKQIWGIFNLQSLTMMWMYLLGFLTALFSAFLMKFLIKSNEKSFFILEMPDYKMPKWNNVGLTVWEKVNAFVLGAGKIIISISIILWFLSNYGPSSAMKEAEKKAKIAYIQDANNGEVSLENYISSAKLEASYAGHFGKFIEPAIEPIGFDWKIGIALLTSFAAREVFVGTISTIYSVGSQDDDGQSLREKLAMQKDTLTGLPFFNLARGLSLLIFYAFALQCMSTIAVVKKETESWKIAIFQFIYLSVLAYLSAFVVYRIFV
jgi:ferrous iron transport protein B